MGQDFLKTQLGKVSKGNIGSDVWLEQCADVFAIYNSEQRDIYICPRSSDPFYKVSYYHRYTSISMVTT